MVWNMLHDTNLRSTNSDSLRSYLHMYRTPPTGMENTFREAQVEYERIREFIEAERASLVEAYRNALDRPSTLLIEVRKDLVWDFDDGVPIGPRTRDAQFITRHIAQAVSQYLSHGRAGKARSQARSLYRYE
jgi:hypothetical protein